MTFRIFVGTAGLAAIEDLEYALVMHSWPSDAECRWAATTVRVAQGWQCAGGPLRQHHADGLATSVPP
jgi:hypothetical protein